MISFGFESFSNLIFRCESTLSLWTIPELVDEVDFKSWLCAKVVIENNKTVAIKYAIRFFMIYNFKVSNNPDKTMIKTRQTVLFVG